MSVVHYSHCADVPDDVGVVFYSTADAEERADHKHLTIEARVLDLMTDLDCVKSAIVALDPSQLDYLETSGTARAVDGGRRCLLISYSLLLMVAKSYGRHWKRRIRIATMICQANGHKTAIRYLRCQCGGVIYKREIENEPTQYKITGRSCRHKLCPTCSRKKAAILRRNLTKLAMTYSWPSFITLTLQHDMFDSLESLLDRLQQSWRNLRKFRGLSDIAGGVKIVEIKLTENGWHPHIHIIADARWIDRDKLAKAWAKASGGSYIVDVRRLREEKEIANYVSKYLTKSWEVEEPDKMIEFADATKGRRMNAAFGTSYGTKLLEVDEDQLDTAPDEKEGWHFVGSYDQIFDRYLQGSKDAEYILDQLSATPKEIHDIDDADD